jgi:hypothetical protein
MDWILEAETTDHGHTTLKNQDAIVIAHNFKGYDVQFILNYLVHTVCIKPSVILNGSKILCLDVCGIKFIDSYNFLPSALAKMPVAFGLSELKKGYFPHFFNTAENQHYMGPYPDPQYSTTCPLPTGKRSSPGATNRKKKTFDLQNFFWITIFQIWIFYAVTVPNSNQPCMLSFVLTCFRNPLRLPVPLMWPIDDDLCPPIPLSSSLTWDINPLAATRPKDVAGSLL